MVKTFIISDEQVNNYGFRVLTDGIDTSQYERNPIVLYMHNRNVASPKGNEIIGKAIKVYKKDNKLYADIEFDIKDEFAKTIAGKVERGFIKMASPYLIVNESSSDKQLMLEHQTGDTVVKSKLKEISIVDLGGNDGALKLLDQNNQEIKLADFSKQNNQIKNKMSFKSIALAMGLNADATETDILNKIAENKTANNELSTKLGEIQAKVKLSQDNQAKALIAKGKELGLIPNSLEDSYVKLFDADFEGTKVSLVSAIATTEKEAKDRKEMPGEAKLFLDNLGKQGTSGARKEAKLTDFNEEELLDLQKTNPKAFAKLIDEYAGEVY